jgi:hypothetical protein
MHIIISNRNLFPAIRRRLAVNLLTLNTQPLIILICLKRINPRNKNCRLYTDFPQVKSPMIHFHIHYNIHLMNTRAYAFNNANSFSAEVENAVPHGG